MCEAIQSATTSTRAVASTWSWGQSGPSLSMDTRRPPFLPDGTKYGAPESYVHALVVDVGAKPCTPTYCGSTVATFSCPCWSFVPGVGSTEVRLPQPASVTFWSIDGARWLIDSGSMPKTGLSSSAIAMSLLGDWYTVTTLRVTPGLSTVVVPSSTDVGYGTGPDTGLRAASWKQWPAVMIHFLAIKEPEQALLYLVPSGFGMSVMVSFAANLNVPCGTSEPLATADAGAAVTTAAASAKNVADSKARARMGKPPDQGRLRGPATGARVAKNDKAVAGITATAGKSVDADQVDDEDEGLARLDDAARAAVAVSEVRRDDELAAAADLHARDALVPAGDDLAGAEAEPQRLAAVPGRVELLAGRVRDADVVHGDGLAGRGLRAVTDRDVGDLEVGRRVALGAVDLGLFQGHGTHRTHAREAAPNGLRPRAEKREKSSHLGYCSVACASSLFWLRG